MAHVIVLKSAPFCFSALFVISLIFFSRIVNKALISQSNALHFAELRKHKHECSTSKRLQAIVKNESWAVFKRDFFLNTVEYDQTMMESQIQKAT